MALLRTNNRLATPGTRSERGNGRGEWDWFYALPAREQNRLRYYMSPDGLQPDEWAAAEGYDDVEAAMTYWRGLVAESRTQDEWDGEYPEGYEWAIDLGDPSEWDGIESAIARRADAPEYVTADELAHALDALRAELSKTPKLPGLIGMRGIAELFGVSNSTVRMWKTRGQLPPADEIVDGTMHVWARGTIRDWVREIQSLS